MRTYLVQAVRSLSVGPLLALRSAFAARQSMIGFWSTRRLQVPPRFPTLVLEARTWVKDLGFHLAITMALTRSSATEASSVQISGLRAETRLSLPRCAIQGLQFEKPALDRLKKFQEFLRTSEHIQLLAIKYQIPKERAEKIA